MKSLAQGLGPIRDVEDDRLRQDAARALINLAFSLDHEDESQELMRRSKRIESLMVALSHEETWVRRKAASALWKLSANVEYRLLIGKSGAIAPLLALLGDAHTSVRQKASAVLWNLSVSIENRVFIENARGIERLVASIVDADPVVRQRVIAALVNLSSSLKYRVLIVQAGGIAPLVAVLGDKDAILRQHAAAALWNLALNVENKVLIAQAGGVPLLVARLRDMDALVRQKAAGALMVLADNRENKLLIAQAGGVASLLALLSEHDATTRSCAVNVLRLLVNVSLWYEQDIAFVLEEQEKRETTARVKKGLRYILEHWQKKPDSPSVVEQVGTNDQALAGSSVSSSLFRVSDDLREQRLLPGISTYRIQASELELGRCLGRGTFGEVYEARYQCKRVAVKKCFSGHLRPNDRAKITDEIGPMLTLKHKYLVSFLGVIQSPSGGSLNLVMEYASRGSLYGYLGAHREISWSWRLRASEELAQGLAYLHQKNVVHRDIKSMNVALDEELHVKWCDFGWSVLKQKTSGAYGAPDQLAGIRWMAPELFQDTSVANKSTDIWSYGMLLFELATQTVPYHNLNQPQVMARLMRHQAEEVPEVCRRRVPKFASLMEACWMHHEDRPDASRLVEVLAEARAESDARKRQAQGPLTP